MIPYRTVAKEVSGDNVGERPLGRCFWCAREIPKPNGPFMKPACIFKQDDGTILIKWMELCEVCGKEFTALWKKESAKQLTTSPTRKPCKVRRK